MQCDPPARVILPGTVVVELIRMMPWSSSYHVRAANSPDELVGNAGDGLECPMGYVDGQIPGFSARPKRSYHGTRWPGTRSRVRSEDACRTVTLQFPRDKAGQFCYWDPRQTRTQYHRSVERHGGLLLKARYRRGQVAMRNHPWFACESRIKARRLSGSARSIAT